MAVLVAGDDQLDQWMIAHPTELFTRPPEPAVVNPANPYVLLPHLAVAAFEHPITPDDERFWPGLLDDGVRRLVLDDRLRVQASPAGAGRRVGRLEASRPTASGCAAGRGRRSASPPPMAIWWAPSTRVAPLPGPSRRGVPPPGSPRTGCDDLDLDGEAALVDDDDDTGELHPTPDRHRHPHPRGGANSEPSDGPA